MPTKRTRRTRSRIAVSEVALFFLSDGLIKFELQKPETGIEAYDTQQKRDLWWWSLDVEDTEEEVELWQQSRDFILQTWIKRRPGTRPKAWWKFSAPEKTRRRLGGVGDPVWKLIPCEIEEYEYGLPTYFVSQRAVDDYNAHHERHFNGRAIDPRNPPIFESQAAYLKRHGLLTASEKGALGPENFEPEKYLPDEEEDD